MPPKEDEINLDETLEQLPAAPVETHDSPEFQSAMSSGQAAAEMFGQQVEPPKQELGVLGNVGIGLNLLGILGGVPEARAIGGTLLDLLGRQQQQAIQDYRFKTDQAQRQGFAQALTKQYEFSPEDKKILPSLSVSAQSELARAKDRQIKLKQKSEQEAAKIGAFNELISELPGNDRLRISNIYKVGGPNAALAELNKKPKVDPVVKDIIEIQALGLDPRDSAQVGRYYQEKGLSEDIAKARFEAVNSRFSQSPGLLDRFMGVLKSAVNPENFARGSKKEEAAPQQRFYINPALPPNQRFAAIPGDQFNADLENKVISAGYRSVSPEQYEKARRDAQLELKPNK